MTSTLAPYNHNECGSPGSSIFDLPTSHDLRAVSQSNTQISTEIPGHVAGRAVDALDIDDVVEGDEVPSCLVISGGTGCNAICSAFGKSDASYVLPVSDDGGSSSEIIRVIGGPSIGA